MSLSSTPSGKVPPRFVPTLTEVVQVPDPATSAGVADAPVGGAVPAPVSGAPVGAPALPPKLTANDPAPTPPPPVATSASVPPLVWDDVATPPVAPQPTSIPKPFASQPFERKAEIAPASKEVTAASLAAARAAKATSLTMSEMLAKLDALPSKKDSATDQPSALFAAPAFRFESRSSVSPDVLPDVENHPNSAVPPADTTALPHALPKDQPKPMDSGAQSTVKTPTASPPTAEVGSAEVGRAPGTVLAPEPIPTKPALQPSPPAPLPLSPNAAPPTFKRWGGATTPVPPEKILRPVAQPASFPIVDLPKPAATPVPAPARVAPPIPEGLEEYLVHRVMQRVDLALEKQLQDAVERVIKDQTQSLVTHLREEVESVVRQSVYEAVAQELVVASASTAAQ